MANRQRGFVEIELGGKMYEIRLGTNEMANLDAALGRSFLSILAEGQVGIHVLRQAIYEGLADYRRRNLGAKLTPQKIGQMMEPAKLEYYADKIIEALEAAGWITPEGEDEAAAKGDGDADPTGGESRGFEETDL